MIPHINMNRIAATILVLVQVFCIFPTRAAGIIDPTRVNRMSRTQPTDGINPSSDAEASHTQNSSQASRPVSIYTNQPREINEHLAALLKEVAELRATNRSEFVITATIKSSLIELTKKINMTDLLQFARELSESVGNLMLLALTPAIAQKPQSYRAAAVPTPELLQQYHPSTRALAAQLTQEDIVTLTLITRNCVELAHDNIYQSCKKSHDHYLNRIQHPSAFIGFTAGMSMLALHYPESTALIAAALTGLMTELIMSQKNLFTISNNDLQLKRIRDRVFNESIESFTNILKLQFGDSIQPLIEAIHSGNVNALRSAACQFALAPAPAQPTALPPTQQVRVDITSPAATTAAEPTEPAEVEAPSERTQNLRGIQ